MTSKTTTEPATTLTQGDTISVPLRVLDVKASDHSYFGPHDIVTVEVTAPTAGLPQGLRFQLRRPHDGSNDLRSATRKERKLGGRGTAAKAALPTASPAMTRDELLALADAQGIDTGAKPSKAKMLKLLRA